jgi:hypothetical protein
MNTPRWPLTATLGLSLAAGAAPAAEPRDPMKPPPLAAPRSAGPPVAAAESAAPQVHQLLVIDGQRFVIDGGRRRGVGDLLGDARIERIEDSAVVVRRGAQTLRLPLFAGITKRVVVESPAPDTRTAPPPARTALAAPSRAEPPSRPAHTP